MPLRLSPEDQADYDRQVQALDVAKQEALQSYDMKTARHCRQKISALYEEFEKKQLPPPPLTPEERESQMSVHARLDRLERLLRVGRYAP